MLNATKKTSELINGKHRTENYWQTLNLNVDANYYGKLAVYAGNWYICNADDIDEMIAELTAIKEAIETVERTEH
jgi:hypothetical protein